MNLHDKDENLYEENKKEQNSEEIETKNEKELEQIKNEDSSILANKENINETDNDKQKDQEIINTVEKQIEEVKSILNENEESSEKNKKEEESKHIEHCKKKSNKKIIIAIIIVMIIILTLLTTGFALINLNNTKIIAGVSVNGIKIEGLTKEEAVQKLLQEYEKKLKKEITITSTGFDYSITGEQIEAKLEAEKAINKAYEIGRNKSIFENNLEIAKALIEGRELSATIEYNIELLETVISDIKAKLPNALIENNYEINEDKLIITKGHSGNNINTDKLKKQIINILQNNIESKILLNIEFTEPTPIDIDKIYEDVHSEAKDAYYTTEPFQIFPHVNGIDFDVEKAKELLKEDKEKYEIELIITEPKITTNKIGTEAFPNLLSSFSTKYDAGLRDRSKNLELATEALNGTVVMPGEIFSYNKTLGERTVAKGYKNAAGFAGGKVVQTLGGGICQISSTIYDAAVYANLEIIERYNHAFLTSYIGAGKDATVVYGNLDFKFRNTRKYPIMIKASASGGIAKVEIYGIREETEYEIEISSKILGYISYKVIYEDDVSMEAGTQKVTQNGMNGCRSITYKIYKLNGVEVKRETLSTDTYDAMNKYITRGATIQPEETVAPVIEDPNPIETPKEEEKQPVDILQEGENQEGQQNNELENINNINQEDPIPSPDSQNEVVNNAA